MICNKKKRIRGCGLVLAAFIAAALGGCVNGKPPKLSDVAKELGAESTAAAVCVLAHSYDGKVPQADVVAKVCAKREYAEAWLEIAIEAEALVKAQRAGKARP